MTVDVAPAETLRLSVIDSFEAGESLRAEWDQLAVDAGAGVYLSFDHCAVWWRHYGRGRSLHLLVFRAGETLVGVLPMFVGRVWLGPVWLRMAGIVGSDSTLAVHDLPIRSAWAREIFASSLAHLLGSAHCDTVKFSPLAKNDEHLAALRAAVHDMGPAARIARDVEVGPYTVFDLPESFDAYLASLSKNHRGNYRRGEKSLRQSHGLRVDVVDDPGELSSEMPKFKAMHDAQWRAEGKLGHFGDWPLSESYHGDLVRAHATQGRAHLLRLSVGDEVVSYELCYSVGSRLHWFLPARAPRADLEKFSIGRLGLIQMIEFAIRSGFRCIEAGVGHYDYKLQLGGTEHAVRSIVVARNGVGTSIRLRTFGRLADALHTAYYQGWFKKVAPKLPLPRQPLWNTWIRSRL